VDEILLALALPADTTFLILKQKLAQPSRCQTEIAGGAGRDRKNDQPRRRALLESIQNHVTIQGSKAKPKAKIKAKPNKSKPPKPKAKAAHKH
jgi:hypothetical protein